MSTWDDSKSLINGLWPQHEFTREEGELFRADLASLDQDMLADAIRNTKRNHDTAWIHLKWLLDEYRQLKQSKARAVSKIDRGEKLNLHIDADESHKLAEQFMALIDISTREDFDSIETKLLDEMPRMASKTAVRVLIYARARLLGERPQFGTVTSRGDVKPFNEIPELADAS